MNKIYYAGIGSRKTPPEILEKMKVIGYVLATDGYVLRSGGAEGADSAFETGCDKAKGEKQIFLPWKGFNDNQSFLHTPSPEAFELAAKYHPSWNFLKHGAKCLHARNSHQVLGEDLMTPVRFVICYSEGTGGTEQALRIAEKFSVPIINLYDASSFLTAFWKIYEVIGPTAV